MKLDANSMPSFQMRTKPGKGILAYKEENYPSKTPKPDRHVLALRALRLACGFPSDQAISFMLQRTAHTGSFTLLVCDPVKGSVITELVDFAMFDGKTKEKKKTSSAACAVNGLSVPTCSEIVVSQKSTRWETQPTPSSPFQ